jgi:hypothetical protein
MSDSSRNQPEANPEGGGEPGYNLFLLILLVSALAIVAILAWFRTSGGTRDPVDTSLRVAPAPVPA